MQAGVSVTGRKVILESYLEVTGLHALLHRRSGVKVDGRARRPVMPVATLTLWVLPSACPVC